MEISLNGYEWLLRGVVELLDLFPLARLEKEEVFLRKGRYEPLEEISDFTVWVHGASLGEIITLRPFLRYLGKSIGKERILASATTMDGYRRLVDDGLCGHATLLPIELPECLNPFLARMKPRLLLISETEIWPLLMATLARKKIRYGIVNGRINERTVRFIRLFKSLFSEAISNLAFVYTQDRVYSKRYQFLGVPANRIAALGCFKYDYEEPVHDLKALRTKFGIPPGRMVFCFGSTHHGEERIILDALDPYWPGLNATVVIAPRKMDRVAEIEKLLAERHLAYSRLSEGKRPAPHVLLIDTLGSLRELYALSSLAFVGGSLVDRGGHNLMEPAACGVPILSGTHTWNFPSESEALRRACALYVVNDRQALQDVLGQFLFDPAPFVEAGRKAKSVLDKMAGASSKTVEKLERSGFLANGG